MGTTLLLAWSGESFMLSAMPIWVQQMAVGLSLDQAAGNDRAPATARAMAGRSNGSSRTTTPNGLSR